MNRVHHVDQLVALCADPTGAVSNDCIWISSSLTMELRTPLPPKRLSVHPPAGLLAFDGLLHPAASTADSVDLLDEPDRAALFPRQPSSGALKKPRIAARDAPWNIS